MMKTWIETMAKRMMTKETTMKGKEAIVSMALTNGTMTETNTIMKGMMTTVTIAEMIKMITKEEEMIETVTTIMI